MISPHTLKFWSWNFSYSPVIHSNVYYVIFHNSILGEIQFYEFSFWLFDLKPKVSLTCCKLGAFSKTIIIKHQTFFVKLEKQQVKSYLSLKLKLRLNLKPKTRVRYFYYFLETPSGYLGPCPPCPPWHSPSSGPSLSPPSPASQDDPYKLRLTVNQRCINVGGGYGWKYQWARNNIHPCNKHQVYLKSRTIYI